MAAFVVWLNSLSPEILTEIGGGGFSVYDDKVAFWDQSYFRRALVGLKPGNAAMDLMPVASIYCNPHSKVAKFKNVYQALRSYVPSNLRNSPKAAYLAILKSVDEYLGEEHGTLEELSARVNHDSDEFEIVEEWRDLREEIRKLQDSFHPTV